MNGQLLKKYAELLIKHGVNLQKGEMLTISAPIIAEDLVVEAVKFAYKSGAKNVSVMWNDDKITRLAYKHEKKQVLADVPEWKVMQRNYIMEKKSAYLVIISDDPEIFKGIKTEKITAARRAASKAFAAFREATSSNKTRWCIGSYPNKSWAKKMFPELSSSSALKKLWEYITVTMRLDKEDSLAAWREHQNNLQRRCVFLNNAGIKKFHYKNSIGTDFTVGLPEDYIFCGGSEKGTLDGIDFTANMPTEEVFSCPDRLSAEGKLVAAMPLVRNGSIIKNFEIDFHEGRIVDFKAEEGYENLKSIIETDEGSHYLGEIALVGFDSPIRSLKTLFYETLFDENASCHFAMGDCYPNCVKGGDRMTEEELKNAGLNSSLEHVDFMVGTEDLSITAETADGKVLEIFKNGKWTV